MPVSPRRSTPALLQVDSILLHLTGAAALTEVCRFLRAEFAHFSWIGVYRRAGDSLELAGWDGEQPTQHTRISVGEGVCGRAAREGRTVLVEDVTKDPEYLACFLDTRSEIVVPVWSAGQVLGEIDVDGRELKAFDGSDARSLEAVAARIAPVVAQAAGPAGPVDASSP